MAEMNPMSDSVWDRLKWAATDQTDFDKIRLEALARGRELEAENARLRGARFIMPTPEQMQHLVLMHAKAQRVLLYGRGLDATYLGLPTDDDTTSTRPGDTNAEAAP